MLKDTIRKEYLERRIQLSAEQLRERSVAMAKQFESVVFAEPHELLSYYPFYDHNEFDVSIAAQIVRRSFPQVRTSWPKLAVDGFAMEAVTLDMETLFVKNRYNILEPLDGETVPPTTIDIVFVPLIAFDNKGYRVGYGKGYYDRYLARCRPGVFKIGFSFFEAVGSLDDIHQFDIPLTHCISPMRVYEF